MACVKAEAERDEALAKLAQVTVEIERAQVALGGFGDPSGPFGGDLANGINAISMRCAGAEKRIAQLTAVDEGEKAKPACKHEYEQIGDQLVCIYCQDGWE